VHNLRLWPAPDTRAGVRPERSARASPQYTQRPERIVVELSNARLQDGLAALDVSHSYIAAVRAAEQADGKLRITLELNRPVRPKTFLLKPAGHMDTAW